MNEEEKQAIEILKSPLLKSDGYDRHQKAIDIILKLIEKQQNEIKRKDKILTIFKKYGLDEKEYFFSSTSDIIKFVKDMRKLMGIGDE